MLMTPPASPPLTSNPASLTRSISHSAVTAVNAHHPNSSSSSQQLLSAVPSSTVAALSKMAQAAHSWKPEDAARLAEQAWQDTVLSPAGLARCTTDPVTSSAVASTTTQPADSKDSSANLWDFIDPTQKSSCICVK